jgi:hypothetical protein
VVRYKDEITNTLDTTWTVKIFGSGMGDTQMLVVKYSAELESARGDHKLIFLTVPLHVLLIFVYENGSLVGKGLRTEAATDNVQSINPGVASRPLAESLAASANATFLEERFPLSEDTSTSAASYSRTWTTQADFEYSAGIKAFDMGATAKTRIKRQNAVSLTFKLPAGRDYVLKCDKNGSGIWWTATPPRQQAE